MRQITAEELANLPMEWENPTVDTSKYYQCVLRAFEVGKEEYEIFRRNGELCQEHEGRYYVA